MAFADFSDLKANVRSAFGDRSDIPTFVYDLATAELNSELRLTIMETETTLSASTESTALPSDFLEARHVYLDRDNRIELEFVSEFGKNADYRSSGLPRTYTIIDGFILLNPIPDDTQSVILRYIASLAAFSLDADTNTVLTTYPGLYLYASLKHTAMWANDMEMAQMYGAALQNELKRVRRADTGRRFGGGPLNSSAKHAP